MQRLESVLERERERQRRLDNGCHSKQLYTTRQKIKNHIQS